MRRLAAQTWHNYNHSLCALVIAIAYIVACKHNFISLKISNNFLSTSITILAIAIGFIGTIQTLLLSLQSTKVIRDLKSQEFKKGFSYYRFYLKQLHSVITNGFFAIAISLVLFVSNEPGNEHLNIGIYSTIDVKDILLFFWIYSISATGGSFFKSINGMNAILNSRGNSEYQ